jgi:hypothetical protein
MEAFVTNLRQMTVMLGAIAIFAITGPGCGGGGTGSGGSAGSSSDGGGGEGGAAGGNGGSAGSTMTTGGNGTGGSTGGTGGTGGMAVVDPGVQATDFVSAGGLAKSANFKMVFTLGQSTQNQGRTKSTNYTMQGGLIGATGSLK